MNQETGGQAFPCEEPSFIERDDVYAYHSGMTLRDYFAAKALQGICASGPSPDWASHGWTSAKLAAEAYDLADAILKEREK